MKHWRLQVPPAGFPLAPLPLELAATSDTLHQTPKRTSFLHGVHVLDFGFLQSHFLTLDMLDRRLS